jgi:RNA polymerase sigma factor (sigma-70 family)
MESLADRVRRARNGEMEAFEELVYEFTPSVYRAALTIVGDQLAADVVQDAFLSAWRNLRRLNDPDRFGAWLHRIAVNRARSVARRHPRRREVPLSDFEPLSSVDFNSAIEARSVVTRALTALSHEQREVIALHYAAGLPLSEVAAVLGKPEGTIKSRLNAALVRLRKVIED